MLKYINTQQFINDYRQYLADNGITNAHIARKMHISPQQLQNLYKKKELTVTDVIDLCHGIALECKINIYRQDIQM